MLLKRGVVLSHPSYTDADVRVVSLKREVSIFVNKHRGAKMSFHNAEPRTREERLAAINKDSVEKGMLKARKGNYHKYHEPGNPLVPEPTSPLYAPEASRFNTDAAAEIREQKLQAHQRQQVRAAARCSAVPAQLHKQLLPVHTCSCSC
jgi:hypothetical protein